LEHPKSDPVIMNLRLAAMTTESTPVMFTLIRRALSSDATSRYAESCTAVTTFYDVTELRRTRRALAEATSSGFWRRFAFLSGDSPHRGFLLDQSGRALPSPERTQESSLAQGLHNSPL
jgi:hypothetical protein